MCCPPVSAYAGYSAGPKKADNGLQRCLRSSVPALNCTDFFCETLLQGRVASDRILTETMANRKGERMPKGRGSKEIRIRAGSQARSGSASVHVVRGEKFELSEAESKLLGDLWERQRSSSRSNYTFTDAPSCI